MTGNTSYRPEVSNSPANTLQYAINQALLNMNTVLPCRIEAVNGSRYTVKVLTNYIDSTGKPFGAPLIYDVPATQKRGKSAGIITEYGEGDSVLVAFCQRDISTVKQNWAVNNPASYRKFSLSDGIIIDYLSNDLPSVYIKITPTGIDINSNNTNITVNAGTANLNINSDQATITANQVTIDSGNINLGTSGVGILNANTQFVVPGAQAGGDTLPVTIVPGTASTTVKATS